MACEVPYPVRNVVKATLVRSVLCRSAPLLRQDYVQAEAAELPVSVSKDADIGDTLKVAALVQHFRSRGHLVAQLDPLRRVPHGPWFGDVGVPSPWYGLATAILSTSRQNAIMLALRPVRRKTYRDLRLHQV